MDKTPLDDTTGASLSAPAAGDWGRGLPVIAMDIIGKFLTLGDLYVVVRVCRNWYETLMNSRPVWRRHCDRMIMLNSKDQHEHPRELCKRLVLMDFNFQDSVRVSYANLERLSKIDGEEDELKFSHYDDSSKDENVGMACVGDGMICIESPAGILFILFLSY